MDPSTAGKALRATLPRSQQDRLGTLDRDPIEILQSQNATRIQDLVPVRFGRMLQSPFAFYRGAAALMATDLGGSPTTDVRVVSCGDAHISNFGFFASPERNLLFYLNDFDEAAIGPHWLDALRLVTSIYIGGRDKGLSEDSCFDAARAAAASYRRWTHALQEMTVLERYYARLDADRLQELVVRPKAAKALRKVTDKARSRTSEQVLDKIATRTESGDITMLDNPPILTHPGHADEETVRRIAAAYAATIGADVAHLLSQFRVTDLALRVVGVGSVGTRCYVVALQGPLDEALFLQVKEARPSVLVTYGGMPETLPGVPPGVAHTQGHRVVAAQRILQASSDPFLGWVVGYDGIQGQQVRVDYYWRQFRDMKGSFDLSRLKTKGYVRAGEVCAALLARAHAQSAGAALAAAYLGSSEKTDSAFARFARAYADVNEQDYAVLQSAVSRGVLPAEFGV